MSDEEPYDRRTVLKLTGGAVAMGAVAGCSGPGGDESEDGGDNGTEDDETGVDGDDTEGNETGADDNETDGAGGDNESEGNETDAGGENETDGNESEGNESAGGEWADVDEIVLEGHTENWIGVEPAPIEGEENPTLVLTEGQEYDLTWENMDGAPHDFVLWDDDGEALESTDQTDEEGEELTLTFEATAEMVEYVCTIHPTTMIGDVEVESE